MPGQRALGQLQPTKTNAGWSMQCSTSSAAEAKRAVALFRAHDEKNLVETHAYYDDERRLMQNA